MKYVFVTEVTPKQTNYTPEIDLNMSIEDKIKAFKLLELSPIDPTVSKEPFKAFTAMKISEETYKFIVNISNVVMKKFGEKEYKINDITFNLYSEKDYEEQFGKLE